MFKTFVTLLSGHISYMCAHAHVYIITFETIHGFYMNLF